VGAALVAIAAVLIGLGAALLHLRQRGARRGGSALGPFLRHFESQGVAPELAAVVFRQLQRWMDAQDRGFAVRPDQDLVSVYGLVPEEVDAALERMARECGRRRDLARAVPRVATVEELVAELARWPAAGGANGGRR
jgi:hypothetical protein